MKTSRNIRVFGNIPGEYSNTKNHYSFERHPSTSHLVVIQVFAIEFIGFIVDFVPFEVEFVTFAAEFSLFAIEFIGFAVKFGALALEFVAFAQSFVIVTLTAANQLLITRWTIFTMTNTT